MREWLYVLGPIAVVAYFVVFPQQFSAFLSLAAHVFNLVAPL
jgi:hypothetical protein